MSKSSAPIPPTLPRRTTDLWRAVADGMAGHVVLWLAVMVASGRTEIWGGGGVATGVFALLGFAIGCLFVVVALARFLELAIGERRSWLGPLEGVAWIGAAVFLVGSLIAAQFAPPVVG